MLRWLVLAWALTCAPTTASAAAAVEGTVALPREAPIAVAAPRYPTAAGHAVGPPEPRAAVVYWMAPSRRPRP